MNVYYSPGEFGLRVVGEMNASTGYDFDMFVVWQQLDTHSNGLFSVPRYVWGVDSGCSCPAPFDYKGVDALRSGSLRDVVHDVEAWVLSRDDEWKYPYRLRVVRKAYEGWLGRLVANSGTDLFLSRLVSRD